MARFVAFLRGVSPMNLRMPDLQRAMAHAGFTNVRTLLSSGNVAFDVRAARPEALARRAEQAMAEVLDRPFDTFVRPQAHLQQLLAADPFAAFTLPAGAKRVVTFLRVPLDPAPSLPIERDGAAIVAHDGGEVFSYYVPGSQGPVFMTQLERTCGKDITTRTWDTVRKSAVA